MKKFSSIQCEAYDMDVNRFECENCCVRKRYHVENVEKCPYFGEFIVTVIKIKAMDLNRIKKYAARRGGNPVNHYIREAIAEYLEKHEKNRF